MTYVLLLFGVLVGFFFLQGGGVFRFVSLGGGCRGELKDDMCAFVALGIKLTRMSRGRVQSYEDRGQCNNTLTISEGNILHGWTDGKL